MRRHPRDLPRAAQWFLLCLMSALLPALGGGCPEFRNQLVDVAETATRSLVLTGESFVPVLETAARGVVDAAIDLVYDRLRTDANRRN